MNVRKAFKAIGWALLYLFICVMVQIGVATIIGVLFILPIVVTAIRNNEVLDEKVLTPKLENLINGNMHLILLIYSVISLIIFALIMKSKKDSIIKVCRFEKIKLVEIIALIMAGLSLNVVISVFLGLLEKIPFLKIFFEQHNDLMEKVVGGGEVNIIFAGIVVGLVAPVFEEIVFRGLILNELKKGFPLWFAVIAQGILFGVFHFNIVQGLYASVLGILFGLVYTKMKNIWAPIVLHILINSSSYIISKLTFLDIPDFISVLVIILSFIVVTIGVVLIILYPEKEWNQDDYHEKIDVTKKLEEFM